MYGNVDELNNSDYLYKIKQEQLQLDTFYNFWRCVTICHDVIIFHYDGVSHYSGKSQDELVLMEAGRDIGHATMLNRDSDSIDLVINGVSEKFQIVKVIEFDSDRKMMTVVVRNEKSGRVYAFNKGADVAILPRIKDTEAA